MTRNLRLYLAFSIAWSLAFFTLLNWATASPSDRWGVIAAAGIVYGAGFALAGWSLGKPDDQSKVRYSLPWAYAAVANLAAGLIGATWILLLRPAAAWGALAWLPVLAFLAIYGRILYVGTVKGMRDKELFQ